jgi:hypothetical protein
MLIETLIPYFSASHLLHSYSSFKRLDGMNLMESVMVCSKSPAARAAAARSLGATPELVEGNGAA